MTTASFKTKALLILLFMAALPLFAQNARRHLLYGDRAFEQKDFEEAELNYRRAELKQPGAQSRYNLGNALYHQDKFEEAEGYFRSAAEDAPDAAFRADALHNLGNAQLRKGKAAAAIESYKQALRLRPGDAETRQNLALALQAQEQQKAEEQAQSEAEEEMQEAGTQDQQAGNPDQNANDPGPPAEGKAQGENSKTGDQPPQSEDQSSSEDGQGGAPAPAMNKTEAEKLLEIMEREEQKVQQRLRRATSAPPKSSKDW